MFQPTSLSLTAKGTKEEPQGTASRCEHAQHKRRKCVWAQDNQSYSHVQTCLAHGGREVWGPCTGHYPPGHHGGLHFDHLPRAPGDHRMVTATWSWQAYWLMVMFWASAITCFPTGFKYVVQSRESWENKNSHI